MDLVLNWLWQGLVIAAAAFVMLRALERTRANIRYVVCWAALVAIIGLPALLYLQSTAVSILSAPQADPLMSLPDTWWTSTLVLLAAWIAWATVYIGRFIAAVVAIRRARARVVLFQSNEESRLPHWVGQRGAPRRATLVISEAVSNAAVLGWGMPMIAVSPSLVETLDAADLDRVVIHEWAHVQRRDDFFNVLQIVMRTIAGWHPAVWWIDRRLHIEREMACDEMAVAVTGSPKTYAECLMKLVSLGGGRRTLLTAPTVLSSSGLRARIVKIISTPPSIVPFWSRGIAVAIVTILCVLSVALAGLRLVETTVLTLPIVFSPQTLTTAALPITPAAVHRIAPTVEPASAIKTDRTVRTVDRVRLLDGARAESAVQAPSVETLPPVTPPGSQAANSASPPPAILEVAALPVLAIVPPIVPEPSGATADKPSAPWTVAADGSVAIGKKSRDAGVATAGFFTRVARRVAGSF